MLTMYLKMIIHHNVHDTEYACSLSTDEMFSNDCKFTFSTIEINNSLTT